VGPELEPNELSSGVGTRSKIKAETKAKDAAATSYSPTSDNKTTSLQVDDDNEVQFLWAQSIRRVVGRYLID
jgi:hypothetical protein